jgi:hypothetical protein
LPEVFDWVLCRELACQERGGENSQSQNALSFPVVPHGSILIVQKKWGVGAAGIVWSPRAQGSDNEILFPTSAVKTIYLER